jgi:opacity protein-like surface antigen
MTRSVFSLCLAMAIAVAMTWPAAAAAQAGPAPRPQPAAQPLTFRGFVDIGALAFNASDSFDAVLGSRSGTLFGGGGEVVLPQRFFAGLRISRFQKDGERVFVFNDEVFPLGIPTTIQIRPVEVSGGYRFGRANSRVVPYFGGGVGWHRYRETSEFAEDDENVDETHVGYHLLGGAEARVARWVAVGGEAQWSTVPDALGQDSNGVSAAFNETNLGGVAFRVKFVIGR